MRFTVTKILGVLLTGVVLLIPSHGLAQGQSQADQISEAKQESSPPTPDLADFVPLAAELNGRLTTLENENACNTSGFGSQCRKRNRIYRVCHKFLSWAESP